MGKKSPKKDLNALKEVSCAHIGFRLSPELNMALITKYSILIIIVSVAFSCSKKDEPEFVDEKPVTRNSEQQEKEKKDKPDTTSSNSYLPGIRNNNDTKNYTRTYNPVAIISPLEAGDYLGKDVTVKGLVADIYKSEKVAYLNFVEKYPENPFTAVIFASRFSSFPDIDKYEFKTVEVTGRVTSFKGKPQIILDSESQIKVVK